MLIEDHPEAIQRPSGGIEAARAIGSCVSASILENSAPFEAGIAQLVERDLAKVEATSSNLVTRSIFFEDFNHLLLCEVRGATGSVRVCPILSCAARMPGRRMGLGQC